MVQDIKPGDQQNSRLFVIRKLKSTTSNFPLNIYIKGPHLFLSSISDEEHIVHDTEAAAGVRHDHERAMERTERVPARCGLFVNTIHRQNDHDGLWKVEIMLRCYRSNTRNFNYVHSIIPTC